MDEFRMSTTIRYTGNFTPDTSPLINDEYTKILMHFNDGSGSTVADSSGNGKNGIIRNSATFITGYAWTDTIGPLAAFSLLTRGAAKSALDQMRQARERADSVLAGLGAQESRLSVAYNNLAAMRENFQAAAGRILDTDVASDSAIYASTQITQQVAASVLAQANQQPSLALRLLQG